jgi:hypothetical protein
MYGWGLLITLFLIGIVTVTIWGIRTFTSPQPIPSFNPPGCVLPCLAGVTPGETEARRAAALIALSLPHTPRFLSDGELSFQESPDGYLVYLDFDSTDPREGNYVKQIEASTGGKGKLTTLGALIATGLTPTRVFRNGVGGPDSISLLIVFGTDQQVVARVGATKIVGPETPIDDLITIAKESWILDDICAMSHFDDEIAWLGFRPVETYWNAPPQN